MKQLKLHTTLTMRIICAIFDYSTVHRRIGAQSTWGDNWTSHFCLKIYACNINKMPKFYLIFCDDRLRGSCVVGQSSLFPILTLPVVHFLQQSHAIV